jgi:outer membrane protein OmpA-like peptidoglycan-associated protein
MTQARPTVLLALALLQGCAATLPTELARARLAYHQASMGHAATLVPADLHIAHVALQDAEAAFKSDPRGYHTADLAYVAERKAELAEALAATAEQEKAKASADVQYQATQQAIIVDTKERLGETQSDLAASQAATARTATQLSASEAARVLAEARTAEAMAALGKLAAVKEEARGLVITLSGSVLFRSGESTLLPEATLRLGQVTDALLAASERMVIVEGHTDTQGSDSFNLDLSQRRAATVRTFLVERGYDPAHVRAVGIGEARPVADNATPEGRANNRRVEIILEGRSISGM